MIKTENFEKVEVRSSEDLRTWLLEHYAQSESVWLVTYKKSSPHSYVSRWEVLDELICFGWIDGIRRKLDDQKTMQLISPRRVEHWAKTYKERAEKLINAGRMHESGLASIQSSKEKGLWDFMNDVDNLVIPEDLGEALKNHKVSSDFFLALNDSSKRFALRWLKLAKTDKTRKSRIIKLLDYSAKGLKIPGS